MKKSIFLVDADDTVLDFHGASSLALQNAFVSCGLDWKDEYKEEYKRFNDSLWEKLERKEITRAELVVSRFPLFLEHLGLAKVGEKFNEYYLKYLSTHPLFVSGAEEFLKNLRKIGRVYIVTNGTEWIQKSRFSISGLFSMCEEAFISDCIGYDKPSPKYTQYVLAHIPDFNKEEAVWIGDSLSADIKAANEAQITSIWYNPNGKSVKDKVKPDYIAKDFNEIISILKK